MRSGFVFTRSWIVLAMCAVLSLWAQAAADSAEEIVRFTPATKEQSAAADIEYKKTADEVAEKLHVHFQTLVTPHFLVFTDWDEREFSFLKENVEEAYTAVCRQFNASERDNVFIGHLPIYMFATQDDFENFSEKIDHMKRNKLIAGYFRGDSTGVGHMAMWKPDIKSAGGNIPAAERAWAYVLTHEFTHAYVARYRTNVFLPRWVNEGLAEVVAYRQFPRANIYDFAHRMAANGYSLNTLFAHKDITSFGAQDYPIAQTVVEAMLHDDPQMFLKFFNDLKDGMDIDDALAKEYHTNEGGLQRAWKIYALSLRG
jgi:hypothetical protein